MENSGPIRIPVKSTAGARCRPGWPVLSAANSNSRQRWLGELGHVDVVETPPPENVLRDPKAGLAGAAYKTPIAVRSFDASTAVGGWGALQEAASSPLRPPSIFVIALLE